MSVEGRFSHEPPLAVFPVAVLAMALLNSAPARGQDNLVAANQEVRIQQLEGQIRTLNGQLEQMNFRLRQMTDRLDKLVADVDFRLRQMEGGAPATADGQGCRCPEPDRRCSA